MSRIGPPANAIDSDLIPSPVTSVCLPPNPVGRPEPFQGRTSSSGLRRVASALVMLTGMVASGAAPVLDQIFPAVVRPGTTNSIRILGKYDPWPASVWSGSDSIRWTATTNAGVFEVVIPPDAAAGASLVRLYNAEGASAPRFLLVTTDPLMEEVEPNDLYKKAQSLTNLPVSISGRLEKSGDVDSYAVSLSAGETLVAHVDAYLIQSPIDAVLRVLDNRGVQVAWNHDNGRTLDPAVSYRATAAGEYVVQVFGFDHPANSDVKFGGNGKCVYRLRLSKGAVARYTLPLGLQRGTNTLQRLVGWSPDVLGNRMETRPGPATNDPALWRRVEWAGIENTLELPVSDGPELVEKNVGGTLDREGALPLPGAVTGVIATAGEIDRYRFQARKDEPWTFAVLSAEFGFPLDAWLRIEDASGKELVRSDDSSSADPLLDWTVPADGAYAVAVGSLVRRGGPDFVYRLAAMRRQPGFKATVPADSWVLEGGKTNEIKVALVRQHGYAAKFEVALEGLPEGVSCPVVAVSEKDSEAVLKLTAAETVKPASGTVRVRVREPESGREHWARFEMASTGENNGVPQGYRHLVIEWTDRLWLTVVKPAPKPEAKPEEKK